MPPTAMGLTCLPCSKSLDGEFRSRKVFQNVTLQNSSQQAVEIGARLLKEIYDGDRSNRTDDAISASCSSSR